MSERKPIVIALLIFFFLRIFQLIIRINVSRTFWALISFIIIWSSIRNYSFIFMNKQSWSKRTNSPAIIIINVWMEFEQIIIIRLDRNDEWMCVCVCVRCAYISCVYIYNKYFVKFILHSIGTSKTLEYEKLDWISNSQQKSSELKLACETHPIELKELNGQVRSNNVS